MEVLRFKNLFYKHKCLMLIPASLGMLLAHNNIFAASTTSSFTISSTVAASCTVSATGLSFGSYTLAQIDQTSSINVTCTNGTTYDVTLNVGTASGATVTTRQMTGPTVNSVQQYLSYSLYKDSSRSQNWGNTSGAGGTGLLSQTGTGAQVTHTVYGRIPANQTASLGNYNDNITVTVSY